MSEFGDHTPHQELLEAVQAVIQRFRLTQHEATILLLKVTAHIADPYDGRSDELRLKKEKEKEQ